MYGKVKRLRAAGKRLSDHEIARSDFAQGEVRVFGLAGVIVASVTDPNSQVGEPLLPCSTTPGWSRCTVTACCSTVKRGCRVRPGPRTFKSGR